MADGGHVTTATDVTGVAPQVQRMWKKADINEDKHVDFNEFCIMRRELQQRATQQGSARARDGKGKKARKAEEVRPAAPADDDEDDPHHKTMAAWVGQVKEARQQQKQRVQEECAATTKAWEARFKEHDSLAQLTHDELNAFAVEISSEGNGMGSGRGAGRG